MQSGRQVLTVAFLTCLLLGCATVERSFVPSGSVRLAAKPATFEVPVFFDGAPPNRSYEVIGMVYATGRARTKFETVTENEVVDLLKEEARSAGADAIIDVRVIPDQEIPRWRKRAEGKAVVFRPI